MFSSQNHYEFIIFFREFTLNSWRFREFTRNLLFFREFTGNSLSISRICYFFAKILWIYHLYANSLWIHHLFRELTLNPLFCEYTMNILSIRKYAVDSISISRLYFEFTICFANILWIHYLFREVTMNLLYFSRMSSEFIFCRIHYLLLK